MNVPGGARGVVSRGVLRRLWDAREQVAYGYAGKPYVNVPIALVASLATGEIAGR